MDPAALQQAITEQGEKVRSMKAANASKPELQPEIDKLLALKAQAGGAAPPAKSSGNEKKSQAKNEKKPQATNEKKSSSSSSSSEGKSKVEPQSSQDTTSTAPTAAFSEPVKSPRPVDDAMLAQADKIRALKSAKAPQAEVQAAVDNLMALKSQVDNEEKVTGKEVSIHVASNAPAAQASESPLVPADSVRSSNLDEAIREQGDIVRALKSGKAPKIEIDSAVKKLLELKAQAASSQGAAPAASAPAPASTPASKGASQASADSAKSSDLDGAISEQGEKVRSLKTAKAPKAEIDAAVKKLLELKAQAASSQGSAPASKDAPTQSANKNASSKQSSKSAPSEKAAGDTEEKEKSGSAKQKNAQGKPAAGGAEQKENEGEAAAAATESFGGPRRDALVAIELAVQKQWAEAKAFDQDAPADGKGEKFFGTFPFPYMNGKLHLGHAFSLSKLEFAARYQRLLGKKVLYPFGFHCTGMPIAACSDKLKREVAAYGNPPIFPEEPKKPKPVVEKKVQTKKKKEAKKKSGQTYQWNIMREMGVAEDEIIKFRDAEHWLYYFPPIAVDDLKRWGIAADFRRSFITTEVNPYYDSFIRWQFNTLKKASKVLFGSRNSIYSPLEKQPCADHDRASGEGVNPQEYTLIKIALCTPFPAALDFVKGRNVFLPAATLRPETMYGQTNVFVLPEGDYGVFEMKEGDVFVCSDRSALNMSYQNLSSTFGQPTKLGSVRGQDLLGCAVKAPLTQYERVYVLPLLTIKMTKGTGVVTSVPSDAPDDYAALMDLKNNAELREEYGITESMVMPFDPKPIIFTPGYGNLPAVDRCKELGVESQKDTVKLETIKNELYLESFYKGVMLVGEHKDLKVQQAKSIIKQKMVDAKQAATYSEPESLVMSRSGVECVVALTDQWYLEYGEEKWRNQIDKHLDETMNTFSEQTHKKFKEVIAWLKDWACSRSYGLGTKLPWDTQFVIESLSDSTIYMAYYTVAYQLQGGDLNGSKPGPSGIKPQQLTDDVWNYLFLNKAFPKYPEKCGIPQKVLDSLRHEFEYWYPMDLRVSAKDLIGNHLTMSLYNHAAIWPDQPELWPRSYFCNGHLMINADKMSKSTGNFLTLEQSVERYGADATRLALADAGDTMLDANFAADTANAAILRLTKEEAWFKEVLSNESQLRDGPPSEFVDKIFENDINSCIARCKEAYDTMQFHLALKFGVFDLGNARDMYRANCSVMNKGLIRRYMEVSLILLTPICPHWTQHVGQLIGVPGFIMNSRWPQSAPEDKLLSRQATYLSDVSNTFRSLLTKQKGLKAKALKKAHPDKDEKTCSKEANGYFDKAQVYVAVSYPKWQQTTLTKLGEVYKKQGGLPEGKELVPILKEIFQDPKDLKNVMSFAAEVKEEVATRGAAAFELGMPFDELAFLKEHASFLTRDTGVTNFQVTMQSEELSNSKDSAVPGKPKIHFSNNSDPSQS